MSNGAAETIAPLWIVNGTLLCYAIPEMEFGMPCIRIAGLKPVYNIRRMCI